MNILKTIAAVSAIAVSSFSVNAEVLSIGGITWDTEYDSSVNPWAPAPSTSTDFISFANFTQTEALDDDFNTVLSATGSVETLNGQTRSQYCPAGSCELTFQFSDFLVDSTTSALTGGTLDFYVTTYVSQSVTNNVLWLSLIADEAAATYDPLINAFGGLYSVVENVGQVAYNFNTNTLANGSDISFEGSDYDPDNGVGKGAFEGQSVPAPTTLAIFGLGLLGLARLRKAK